MFKAKADFHTSLLYLLLSWAAYFVMYRLTEHIPLENCHRIHVALDDRIPFCEWFVVFYVGWYVLIALSLGWFLFSDVAAFRKLQTYILLTQTIATVGYILYPSYQDLRPAVFPRENLFTAVLAMIYRLDTPTGVCPSLHVAISIGITSAWRRKQDAPLWLRVGIAVFCLGVCLSVAFVKQHSVVDMIAAIPVCAFAEWFVYFRRLQSGHFNAKIPSKGGEIP